MDSGNKIRIEQGLVLRAARRDAGFKSIAQAVRESPPHEKWKVATLSAHERGDRTIGLDDANRYARFYQRRGAAVTPITILFPGDSTRRLSEVALAELERLMKKSIEAARGQPSALAALEPPRPPLPQARPREQPPPTKPIRPKRS